MIPYDSLTEQDFILRKPYYGFTKSTTPELKIHIGLSKWTNEFADSNKSTKPLTTYSKHFDVVEMNATHYTLYNEKSINEWYNQSAKGFKFCPKFLNKITHIGKLDYNSKLNLVDDFLSSISAFKEKLGPSFIQVSERFGSNFIQDLIDFVKHLPKELESFIEVRSPNWFADEKHLLALSNSFNKLNKGIVITDTPGRRDAVHMTFPIPKAFIRFVGLGNNSIDRFRISEWKKYVLDFKENGMKEVYFFIHTHDESLAINFANYVFEELSEAI